MSDRNNYNGSQNGQNGRNNNNYNDYTNNNSYGNEGGYNGLSQIFQGGQNGRPGSGPLEHNSVRAKATEPLPNAFRAGQPGTRAGGTGSLPTPVGQRVLHGQLTAFSPSSLLSLLNIQKQSGYLHLSNGLNTGSIYVEKGEVWDAKLGPVTGALALFQLFGWKIGEFAFEVGVESPEKRSIEASLPVLQVRATLWLDNWSKYNPIIPSTSHRISIAPEPRSEVVIEPYQWAVLTKIVARPMTIAEIANDLEQDLMAVTKIAADLVKMGVAVVYDPITQEQ